MYQLRGLEICNIRNMQIHCFSTVYFKKGLARRISDVIMLSLTNVEKRKREKIMMRSTELSTLSLRGTYGTVSEMSVHILSIIVLYVIYI